MEQNKRKRIILIVACVIAFVIIILFIFRLLSQKGVINKTDVEGQERLSGVSIMTGVAERSQNIIASQRCTADNKICIHDVVITYEGNRGVITYVIDNASLEPAVGKVRVQFGTHKFVFPYNIPAGKMESGELREHLQPGSREGVYGYDGMNLQGVNSFTV